VVDKEEGRGESSSVIARALKVTVRRVNQVWTECKSTGAIPEIGKNAGRPPGGPLSEDEKEIILKTKQRYKLGARRLEPLIERDYRRSGLMYMTSTGRSSAPLRNSFTGTTL